MADTNYEWAANVGKLKRAIAVAGPEASEETVREAYVKLGGLLKDKNINMAEQEDKVVDAEAIAAPEATTTVDAAAVAPEAPIVEEAPVVPDAAPESAPVTE